uniref:Uncharacterized protein n=1 Tax=Anguilla anguilla TaxID=7936 RepID=A0A0E9V6R5_ANGAN
MSRWHKMWPFLLFFLFCLFCFGFFFWKKGETRLISWKQDRY